MIVEQVMVLRGEVAGAAFDIGAEARLVLGKNGAEFGLYLGSPGFHLRHPVEPGAVIDLDLGQAGEIIAARLLKVDWLAAEQDVEGLIEAGRALSWRDQTVEPCGIVRGIVDEARLGALQARLNGRGQARRPCGQSQSGAVSVAGSLDIAVGMADIAEQKQAAEIIRGLGQHGVQSVRGPVPVPGAGPVEGGLFQLAE